MANGHKNRKTTRECNSRRRSQPSGKRRNGMTHMKPGHQPSARAKG